MVVIMVIIMVIIMEIIMEIIVVIIVIMIVIVIKNVLLPTEINTLYLFPIFHYWRDVHACIMIIKGNKVITTGGTFLSPGYVVVEGSIIKSVSAELLDDTLLHNNNNGEVYEADIVCAGFFDIHNHGLGGADEVSASMRRCVCVCVCVCVGCVGCE